MAAPVVASVETSLPAAGASVTINKPATVPDGSLIYLFLYERADNATIATTPGDWQFVVRGALAGTIGVVWVYVLPVPTASALPASWTFTASTSAVWAEERVVITGADLTNPVANALANNDGVSGTTIAYPSLDTLQDDTLVLFGAGGGTAQTPTTAISGSPTPTELAGTQGAGAGGLARYVYGAQMDQAVAGATGARTQTAGNSTNHTVAVTAIAPATPPPVYVVPGSATPTHSAANTIKPGAYPPSPQAGDVIVAVLYERNNADQVYTPPSVDWQRVGPSAFGVGGAETIYVKRSDGTESGTFNFTSTSGGVNDVITYLVRGVPTDGPMFQTVANRTDDVSDTSYGLPSITTPSPDSLAVVHVSNAELATVTYPGAWSEIYDTVGNVGVGARSQSAAAQNLAAVGDTIAAANATGSLASWSVAVAVIFPSAPAEMPYVGGYAQTIHTNDSLTQAYNLPSGGEVGDWFLVHLQIRGTTQFATLPAGWTMLDQTAAPGSSIIGQQVWVRELDGTEGTTVTATYSALIPGHIEVSLIKAASGVDADTSFGTTTNTTTPTAPGLTTLGDNRLLFYGAMTASSTTLTPPTGFDEIYDLDATPAGAQHLVNYGAAGVQLAAGPSGDKSATATINAQWATFLVAFAPAVTGPPPAPTERMFPNAALLLQTNLTGAYTDIDDDPDSPDAAWLTGTDPSGATGLTNGPEYVDALATVTGFATTTWTGAANLTDTSETTVGTFALGANTTDYGSYFSWNAADWTDLPTDAIIDSVAVTIRMRGQTANRLTAWLRLAASNGTPIATEVALNAGATLPNTLADYTVSAWDAVPTRAQMVTGTFGVRLRMRRSNTVTAEVASIKATVTYHTPGSTTPIQVRAPLSDPTNTLATGAATGEIRALVRKKGTGSDPSVRVEVRNAAGTLLATPIADTAVSNTTGVVLSGTFDQSAITTPTDVVLWVVSAGAAGGLVEVGALEWNGQYVLAANNWTKSFADALAPTDSAVAFKVIFVVQADPLAPADVYARTERTTFADALAPTDTSTRAQAFARSYADALAPTDISTRVMAFARSYADALAPLDVAQATKLTLKAYADALAPTDVMVRTLAYRQAFADPLAPIDTFTLARNYARAYADALAPADSAARFLSMVRGYADTLAATDAPQRAIQRRLAASDALAPTDILARAFQLRVSQADSLAPTDARTASGGYVRAFTDVLTPGDVAGRAARVALTLSDSLAPLDLSTRALAYMRSLIDALIPSDAPTRASMTLRAYADGLAATDAVSRITGQYRALADALAPTDTLAQAIAYRRSYADTLSPADVLALAHGYRKTFADTLAPTDLLTRQLVGQAFTRAFADALAPSDTATPRRSTVLLLADALAATDAMTYAQALGIRLTDALGPTDVLERVIERRRSYVEALALADVLSSQRDYVREYADAIGLTDIAAITPQLIWVRMFADALAPTDIADRLNRQPVQISKWMPIVVIRMLPVPTATLAPAPEPEFSVEMLPLPRVKIELEPQPETDTALTPIPEGGVELIGAE